MKKITVLFVAANPADTDALQLDEEARKVEERLRLAKARERFVLHTQWAARTEDLIDGLVRYRPEVVHFSGHGAEDGRLVFVGQDKRRQLVGGAGLAAVFGVFTPRCVVLNACFSGELCTPVGSVVDAVVGMSREVGDAAAVDFASGFYRCLGEGMSVRQAYEVGRAQVLLNGGAGDTPLLFLGKGDFCF